MDPASFQLVLNPRPRPSSCGHHPTDDCSRPGGVCEVLRRQCFTDEGRDPITKSSPHQKLIHDARSDNSLGTVPLVSDNGTYQASALHHGGGPGTDHDATRVFEARSRWQFLTHQIAGHVRRCEVKKHKRRSSHQPSSRVLETVWQTWPRPSNREGSLPDPRL